MLACAEHAGHAIAAITQGEAVIDCAPTGMVLAGFVDDLPLKLLLAADCRVCWRQASQNARTCASFCSHARSSAAACWRAHRLLWQRQMWNPPFLSAWG